MTTKIDGKAARGTVALLHVQNVDLMYGQGNGSGYWEPPVDKGTEKRVSVRTLRDAQQAAMAYIRRNGLGGGNIGRGFGIVRDSSGTEIARISYNGRVWEPGESFVDGKYTPRPEIKGDALNEVIR